MTSISYNERQNLEMERWPELRAKMNDLFKLVFPSRLLPGELKQFVFTAASLASGCTHCQSHGSYHLHSLGVPDEKIQALWSYQTSERFTPAERAALDLAFAAGVAPNASGPEHFEELRKHYSDEQIIEIVAVIAIGGFLNRWNDTIATWKTCPTRWHVRRPERAAGLAASTGPAHEGALIRRTDPPRFDPPHPNHPTPPYPRTSPCSRSSTTPLPTR